MATWDDIYQQHQQGKTNWATLSEGIDPAFIDFIQTTSFPQRKALDIGCGTGKYARFLEQKDFTVYGIDSSPTAIELTRQVVKQPEHFSVQNMFSFDYAVSRFDLVLSISTLHHGLKEEIRGALEGIQKSLLPNGWIFITLTSYQGLQDQMDAQQFQEIQPGTFAPTQGPEAGIPHSFFAEREVKAFLSSYEQSRLWRDEIGRWFLLGQKA